MAMEPVAQEVFKQRLYELAKDNEAKQTEDPPSREAVTSGDDVLEGMLNDLLGALRREAPMDPLPAEKVAAIKATAQEATATGSGPAESQGERDDGTGPPTIQILMRTSRWGRGRGGGLDLLYLLWNLGAGSNA
ncbi:unnamed protein product [Symbiodinium sp. CCMP2592]|nr:unnamed protein product [Symbiodinium sp. CCMP2592]